MNSFKKMKVKAMADEEDRGAPIAKSGVSIFRINVLLLQPGKPE